MAWFNSRVDRLPMRSVTRGQSRELSLETCQKPMVQTDVQMKTVGKKIPLAGCPEIVYKIVTLVLQNAHNTSS
jgi:hypothetical protein